MGNPGTRPAHTVTRRRRGLGLPPPRYASSSAGRRGGRVPPTRSGRSHQRVLRSYGRTLLKPEYVVSISYELERDLNDRHLDLANLVNPIGRHGMRLFPLGVQDTVWVASVAWGWGLRSDPLTFTGCRSSAIRRAPRCFARSRTGLRRPASNHSAWMYAAALRSSGISFCLERPWAYCRRR